MNRALATVGLGAGSLLLLTGCLPIGHMDQGVTNLATVRFTQSQAVPGFDDSEYELVSEQLLSFRDLLSSHAIDPSSYNSAAADGCTGGIATRVQMGFYGAGSREMILNGCGAEDGTFDAEATAFFARVREGGGTTDEFPNSAIDGVEYLTTGLGADGTTVQDDPAEVQRFRDLLVQYEVVPGHYMPAAGTCSGGVSTTVTLHYQDSGVTLTLLITSCTADSGFSADAAALVAEWRAAA